MNRYATAIHAVLVAAVTVPIFAAIMLVFLRIVPEIFTAVGVVEHPSGVDSTVISFGGGWLAYIVVGFIAIVVAAAAVLFLASRRDQPPRRRP